MKTMQLLLTLMPFFCKNDLSLTSELLRNNFQYYYFITFPHSFIFSYIVGEEWLMLLELAFIVGLTSRPLTPSPFSCVAEQQNRQSQRRKWALTQYGADDGKLCHVPTVLVFLYYT